MFHSKNTMTGAEMCALWEMATNPSTGTTYFYNIESGEVQWDPPTATISARLAVEYKCTIDVQSGEEA